MLAETERSDDFVPTEATLTLTVMLPAVAAPAVAVAAFDEVTGFSLLALVPQPASQVMTSNSEAQKPARWNRRVGNGVNIVFPFQERRKYAGRAGPRAEVSADVPVLGRKTNFLLAR